MKRLLSFAPLFLLACSQGSENPGDAPPEGIEIAKSNLERDRSPQVSDEVKRAVVQDNTAFALSLFKLSAKADANLMQSPHSISTALAMVFAGAAGQTKADVATALHFTAADADLHATFNWLDLELQKRAVGARGKDGKPARVKVDNLLFGAEKAEFGASFLDTLAINYGAGVQRVDFTDGKTTGIINGWVADRTEQRIPRLLDELAPDTRLVLVNTVYINSAWQTPFGKSATAPGAFAAAGGERQVSYMSREDTMLYAATEKAQVVELALATQGLVLDIILPAGELATFEGEQTAASLTELLGSLSSKYVQLALPKFKLQPAEQGSIKPALAELGMASAFADTADFTPMIENDRVWLSDVVHKTFFEIDEDGLEAAAATAAVMRGASLPSERVVVRVDRPFEVVLRDAPSGQILFLGHIVDPTQP